MHANIIQRKSLGVLTGNLMVHFQQCVGGGYNFILNRLNYLHSLFKINLFMQILFLFSFVNFVGNFVHN